MIDHRRALDLAAAAIDFELTPDERASLDAHLSTCSACRERAAAYRSDAVSIAALPVTRLSAHRSVAVLDRIVAPRRTMPRLRMLAIAALITILAAGLAVGVGVEILRRARDDQLADAPTPQEPSIVAPSPSTSGEPPLAFGVTSEGDLGAGHPRPQAVAAGPDGELIVVGGFSCSGTTDAFTCASPISTTRRYGGEPWTTGPVEVGDGVPTSGPELGLHRIAAGHGEFVAIGYTSDPRFRPAIWHRSADGTWTLRPEDPVFAEARLRTVAATESGWVIGGEVFLPTGPRAALWTSRDAQSWVRVADGPAFDVGGYLETGEEPGAGGIRAIATDGGSVVAVGSACDATGQRCSPAVWSSRDLQDWTPQRGVPTDLGSLDSVASTDDGFVALLSLAGDGGPSAAVAMSVDGATWTVTDTTGFPSDLVPRAVGAVGDGVAAVLTQDSLVRIVASHDGVTWETIHESRIQGSVDATPAPGSASVPDLAMTTRSDGVAVIVGWASLNADEPFPFTYLVTVGPRVTPPPGGSVPP
ncbi:MAG TPA: zf-HC2 domain-containing protein [Candidatus Limnocylindrales bacterium]|nr:zf-HC2 domain-containing protein [Candidatus Limnocylindrales bacterium]